jgi:ORF6N domain
MKVMLDFDLAALYEVETRVLNQAVKRNIKRFPDDFMFQLSEQEWHTMSSQFVMTSYKRPQNSRPYAFSEQGLAMLSGVLHSQKAVEVNISIMRAFVFLRQYALTHKDLTEQLKALETKYDQKFEDVYEAIHYLLKKDEEPVERKAIGFKKNKL